MKRILLLVATVAVGSGMQAQDPIFSQFYQNPLYLNPGFTGITPQQRIVVDHRIQWPNLPQAFSTYSASYDIFVDELRSGFGFLATTDKMGSAGWRTTTASLLYSYKVPINEKLVFSPGINFGYGVNGLDRSKLNLGDGLEFNGVSLDPQLAKLGNQQYFDIGAGFMFYTRTVWLGAAFNHMNTPNLSILNETSRLPMKSTIHAGMRLPLYHGPRTTAKVSYLTPSLIYQIQGPFNQFAMGVNYHIDPVSIGFWYRGKVYAKDITNVVSQDALIFHMGLYMKNITFGYSYDFTVSKLSTTSGGAHEITLVYEFIAKPLRRGVKHKNRLIPCPASVSSQRSFWDNR